MAMSTKCVSGLGLLFCWLYLVGVCQGSCFNGPLVEELTEFKRLRQYCVYSSAANEIKLLPGSAIYTADCHDCTCTKDGLQCCGFGYMGGIAFAKGCVQKRDGCESIFVKADNQSLDCYTGKPVDFGSPPQPHPDTYYSFRKENRKKNMSPPSPAAATPTFSTMFDGLQNTKLSPGGPVQMQMRGILNELMTKAQRPYWYPASNIQQVPVDTSAQHSVTFHTDGNTHDAGWLPWMFFLN